MRIKICGITNAFDAEEAALAGADAIGLNFVGGPRCIQQQEAKDIMRALPPMVTAVALIHLEHGQLPAALRPILDINRISHLQLYGEYGGEDLAALHEEGFATYPVVAVQHEGFAGEVAEWMTGDPQQQPKGVVLDTYDPALKGGTGRTFRWDWVGSARQAGLLEHWPPIILAGGLNPDNAAQAIQEARPYGVDVASGVEQDGQPGKKDLQRMRGFVRSARKAVRDVA